MARNFTKGVSWSRVTRFSILDFSIDFPRLGSFKIDFDYF
jgi:hypothetical protein